MTPLQINALLSVYARPGDVLHPLAVESLMNYELIQPVAGRAPGPTPSPACDYELTSRGKAMVNGLMSLPLPQLEERWTIGPADCTEPL
ncbi:MAG TPA: hypothetical protein VF161_02070 [Steroidobacteraceae bacterium]